MKTFMFEGCSDDTFGECTPRGDDYDNCASGEPIEWLLTSPGGVQLLVVGQFCPGAATGWLIGVARADESDDVPIPDWPIRIVPGVREYTPRLIVDAPDGTTMICIQREKRA